MKKTLLSLVAVAFAMTSFAQNFTGLETGWTQNWNAPTTDCAGANSGAVGHMDNNGFTNTNFSTAPAFNTTEKAVQITSSSSVTTGTMAGWNGFLYKDGGNICNYIRTVGGVDMSAAGNGKISVLAKASNAGAKLRIYLGTTGTSGWTPTSSTYNTGTSSSIIWEITLTTSYATYVYDLEAADPTLWGAWGGKSTINQWGFDPQTASTDYFVQRIDIGSNVTAVTSVDNNAIGIYPNPATSEVNVDFLGMDQNGATAKLINANGVVVFEGAISNTFSVASYNKGIYMLQVTSGNKVASKKLVIQ